MINFRYHVVSMIAVFLALGIGIIMGTAVIDRAVVDRLEVQQASLESAVDEVQSENNRLRAELRLEREAARQLAEEGSERLLEGTLTGVPVLVVALQSAEAEGHEDLLTLLARADADLQGTIWLTDRFELDDEEERQDLATALSFDEEASAITLRTAALNRLARALRPVAAPLVPDDPAPGAAEGPDAPATSGAGAVIDDLRTAGFLEVEPPLDGDGDGDAALAPVDPQTRIVTVSAPGTTQDERRLLLPLVRSLQTPRPDLLPTPVLAATGAVPAEADAEDDLFVSRIRADEDLRSRVSTVDGIDGFAGRVAAVLAIADLGTGRTGHYGRGPGAERLLPAPEE